jgi:hypothetical protein
VNDKVAADAAQAAAPVVEPAKTSKPSLGAKAAAAAAVPAEGGSELF